MKQLEVQIMQQSYLLSCPEGREARMLDAVERVDTAMCKIRDAGKIKARDRIAVLAALNMAFDLLDLKTQNSELNQQAEQARSEAAALPAAATGQASLNWDEPRLQSIMQRLDAATSDTAAAATANATAAS